MKYLKRYWNEDFEGRGLSWWYFEIDGNGNVLRQIEEYEKGKISHYDEKQPEDEFGGLAKEPIVDSKYDQVAEYTEIERTEFEAKWK